MTCTRAKKVPPVVITGLPSQDVLLGCTDNGGGGGGGGGGGIAASITTGSIPVLDEMPRFSRFAGDSCFSR